MLHLGNDLAGDFELGADAVDAIGMQPDGGLGDDGSRVELVRNRDPIMAAEAPFREPTAGFAPRGRLMGALALDAPA